MFVTKDSDKGHALKLLTRKFAAYSLRISIIELEIATPFYELIYRQLARSLCFDEQQTFVKSIAVVEGGDSGCRPSKPINNLKVPHFLVLFFPWDMGNLESLHQKCSFANDNIHY